jgi:vacuolar protein sorting-associated protein 33A
MSAGSTALEGGPLDLAGLRDDARGILVRALDSVEGSKVLVLDPKIIGPLGAIAPVSVLKEHGVANMFQIQEELFENQPGAAGADVCVYIACAEQHQTRIFCDHVLNQEGKEFALFFVPRRNALCEKILEEANILDRLAAPVGQIELDFIPYDNDVLSLGLATYFRDLYLEQDTTALFYVAQGLMRLQDKFGVFPMIKTKGRYAQQIKDMLVRMRRERSGVPTPTAATSAVDSVPPH